MAQFKRTSEADTETREADTETRRHGDAEIAFGFFSVSPLLRVAVSGFGGVSRMKTLI